MSFASKLRQDPLIYVMRLEATQEQPARLVAIDVNPKKMDVFQKHLKNPQSDFNLFDYGKVLEMIVGEITDAMLEDMKAKYKNEITAD
ncbi:MAG: hypothetical protein P8P30_03680 [Rickettsiales bacterium]|nr:hypothetical protein [Rickettsiales bacterium]